MDTEDQQICIFALPYFCFFLLCSWGVDVVLSDSPGIGVDQLGRAEFKFRDHLVKAKTDLLKGALIEFPKKSVGATQNTMMAATLAHGRTVIKNASQEPEVVDLANFLVSMGAQINGIRSELKAIIF